MLDFFPQIIFLVVLGLIIFLISRKIPQAASQLEEENFFFQKSFLDKLPLEKIDQSLSIFLEKFLRRLRIFLLKLDAYFQKKIDSLKSQKSLNKEKLLLKTEEIHVEEDSGTIIAGEIKELTEVENLTKEFPEEDYQGENKEG